MNNRNKQYGRVTIGAEPRSLLNSIELQQQSPGHRARWPGQFINNLARAAACYIRRLRARWHRQQRMRATFLALHALDASTLRDLGFHRSEIWSVASEISGNTSSSRVRFVPLRRSPTC